MNVAHVIADLSRINFGIWNAALFASSQIKLNHNIDSCAIVCQDEDTSVNGPTLPLIWMGKKMIPDNLIASLAKMGFTPSNTIIVSHGCWLKPTRLGYSFKKKGFRWIHVPHGMLEPWSLKNGRLKKALYYHLRERHYLQRADIIRAVSKSEGKNLALKLKRKIQVVENGVVVPPFVKKNDESLNFIFMARLHFKKGIIPLLKAWNKVMQDTKTSLTIAGPDEGELEKMKPYLQGNARYVGPVYGTDKINLLQRSHYYLLPSHSEGFPTSVLEAMSYGLIPMISEGCNFPEVFENKLGYQIEPDEAHITPELLALRDKPFDHVLSRRNYDFIAENYSEQAISEKLFSLYSAIFNPAAFSAAH